MSENNAIIPTSNEIQLGSWSASNPAAIINRAGEVAGQLVKIIKDRKLSKIIQQREYVYVDGWATMGAMLGAVAQEVPGLTVELEDKSFEATVEIVRLSDGKIIGRGSARVGMDEKDKYGKPTWANRPSYARRSMAITRAAGKAWRLSFSWIMSLAGYATTPAEEMDGIEGEWQTATTKPNQPTPPEEEQPSGFTREAAAIARAIAAANPPLAPESLANRRQRNWCSDKVIWEMACTVNTSQDRKGKCERYIDLEPERLRFMFPNLEKSLEDKSIVGPDREAKQLKLDTILAIQEADKVTQ